MSGRRPLLGLLAPYAAASGGGALYVAGFLGVGGWPLLGVFLVPLWWAFERVARDGRWAAISLGLTFGAVAYFLGHPWLLRLVDVFLDGNLVLGVGLWSLYGAAFAAGFGLYAAVYDALRRCGVGRVTAGIAPWIALEWIQPWPFPVHAGAALVDVSALVQVGDLGGTLLLSGLVLVANAVVFETGAWLAGRAERPRALWWAAVALYGVTIGYGQWRTADLSRAMDQAESIRVGIVQANLGLIEKRRQAVVSHRRHLEDSRALQDEGALDLIVWPETAYVRALQGPLPLAGRLVSQDLDVPLLFGSTLIEGTGREAARFNSALIIGRDGMIRDAYRKNWLIPIAEDLPLTAVFPGLDDLLPHAQHFRASRDATALRLDAFRIAVPICYEAVRPSFVRRLVEATRANLLVTLANDAWFGDSAEPWIHFQLARMRAIELRRYLVRATNSGISAIVDPLGRVVVRSGILEAARLRGTVSRMELRTVYARLGDWPGPVAALWILIGWGVARRP